MLQSCKVAKLQCGKVTKLQSYKVATWSLSIKKGFLKQKIDQFKKKNFENNVQKGPIFKKKKDFSGQKNKLGLSLKKGFFAPKIDQFKKKEKKRDISGQKNKLGLTLITKKGLFWGKI